MAWWQSRGGGTGLSGGSIRCVSALKGMSKRESALCLNLYSEAVSDQVERIPYMN